MFTLDRHILQLKTKTKYNDRISTRFLKPEKSLFKYTRSYLIIKHLFENIFFGAMLLLMCYWIVTLDDIIRHTDNVLMVVFTFTAIALAILVVIICVLVIITNSHFYDAFWTNRDSRKQDYRKLKIRWTIYDIINNEYPDMYMRELDTIVEGADETLRGFLKGILIASIESIKKNDSALLSSKGVLYLVFLESSIELPL